MTPEQRKTLERVANTSPSLGYQFDEALRPAIRAILADHERLEGTVATLFDDLETARAEHERLTKEQQDPWHLLSRGRRILNQDVCGECGQEPGSRFGRCRECGIVAKLHDLEFGQPGGRERDAARADRLRKGT